MFLGGVNGVSVNELSNDKVEQMILKWPHNHIFFASSTRRKGLLLSPVQRFEGCKIFSRHFSHLRFFFRMFFNPLLKGWRVVVDFPCVQKIIVTGRVVGFPLCKYAFVAPLEGWSFAAVLNYNLEFRRLIWSENVNNLYSHPWTLLKVHGIPRNPHRICGFSSELLCRSRLHNSLNSDCLRLIGLILHPIGEVLGPISQSLRLVRLDFGGIGKSLSPSRLIPGGHGEIMGVFPPGVHFQPLSAHKRSCEGGEEHSDFSPLQSCLLKAGHLLLDVSWMLRDGWGRWRGGPLLGFPGRKRWRGTGLAFLRFVFSVHGGFHLIFNLAEMYHESSESLVF